MSSFAALAAFERHFLVLANPEKGLPTLLYWLLRRCTGRIGATVLRGSTHLPSFVSNLAGYVLSIAPLNGVAKARRKYWRQPFLAGVLRRPLPLYLPVIVVVSLVVTLMQSSHNIYPEAL